MVGDVGAHAHYRKQKEHPLSCFAGEGISEQVWGMAEHAVVIVVLNELILHSDGACSGYCVELCEVRHQSVRWRTTL